MTRVLVLAVLLVACSDDTTLSVEALQDPSTCNGCHPKHYTQWSGSMHAYASDDPVFVAMNKRGQRETNNQLGTFCVQCHAPMAVQLGLTNGVDFDPAKLPATARGVTCYFCHNVKEVQATHNNGLVLANDQTMRGGVKDPVKSPAHDSAYDPQMDADAGANKSAMCGSCHDVVTPRGVPLERTFAEWKTTFFSEDDPLHHLTCGSCHMRSSKDVIADAPGLSVVSRTNGFHEHLWPGVDQAMTAFPERDAQAAAVQRDLDPSIAIVGPAPLTSNVQPGGICLQPDKGISVRIDSISVGHSWPSGAAQDRRAWLEVTAYDAAGAVLFSRGNVPADKDPEDIGEIVGDHELLGFWDRVTKDDGTPAHFFWDVANVDSRLLAPPVTLDKNSSAFDHSTTITYPQTINLIPRIARITARVRLRPLSYAMLRELVASGDLDPALAQAIPTYDPVGATSTWTVATKDPRTTCNPR